MFNSKFALAMVIAALLADAVDVIGVSLRGGAEDKPGDKNPEVLAALVLRGFGSGAKRKASSSGAGSSSEATASQDENFFKAKVPRTDSATTVHDAGLLG